MARRRRILTAPSLSCSTAATSLTVNYRRPTPLSTELRFEVERSVAERRITSTARLLAGTTVLCDAQMSAVAGDLSQLPPISRRRIGA